MKSIALLAAVFLAGASVAACSSTPSRACQSALDGIEASVPEMQVLRADAKASIAALNEATASKDLPLAIQLNAEMEEAVALFKAGGQRMKTQLLSVKDHCPVAQVRTATASVQSYLRSAED